MDEPFPAIGNQFEEAQEASSQRKNDFLLDLSLSSHAKAVSERRSGHLSPERTKRYGMTDFSDISVGGNLLQEFDPLSSQNQLSVDEDPSVKTRPSIERLDSKENMELHRASGLILGRSKETNLANASVSWSDEATSTDFDTEPVDIDGTCTYMYKSNLNGNEGALEHCGDASLNCDPDNAARQEGKAFYVYAVYLVSYNNYLFTPVDPASI